MVTIDLRESHRGPGEATSSARRHAGRWRTVDGLPVRVRGRLIEGDARHLAHAMAPTSWEVRPRFVLMRFGRDRATYWPDLSAGEVGSTRPPRRGDANWWNDAACTQQAPDLFFKSPEEGLSAEEAKRVCRTCPVLTRCLLWALQNPDACRHGVWGGKTPRERESARRAMRA